MKYLKHVFVLIALLVQFLSAAWAGETTGGSVYKFPQGRVELTVLSAGSGHEAGVAFVLDKGWHVYAENPGEIGLPTVIKLLPPAGSTVGALKWPVPESFESGGLRSLGYAAGMRVVAPVSNWPASPDAVMSAELSWAICNDESCIPGEATLQATLSAGAVNRPASGAAAGWLSKLLLAIGAGFLGGLLLNLMPCVFPVLSIKVLALVKHADARAARLHAFYFSAGVILSFWFLAGLLMILRASGQQLGWGFQFQSPFFVALMAVVLLLVSLNLFGVFEVGYGLQTAAGKAEGKGEGAFGAFLSGVLATAVATPCTAPMMATAIAVALARPAWEGFTIFTALACGMAAPFVFLSCFPRFLSRMPRPGNWMVTLKEFLAFPMLASVFWLLWVFQQQAGSGQTLRLELGLVVLGMGSWLYGKYGNSHSQPGRRLAARLALMAAVLLVLFLGWVPGGQSAVVAARVTGTEIENTAGEPFSEARLAELLAARQAVFVDVSAAWCLVCQLNHRSSLDRAEVLQRLKEKNVTLLRADWTNRDPAITAFLGRYEREGVPLDVVFSREGKAEVLPSLLTPAIVLAAIERAG